VSYETIRCWTIKFGPQIARNLKRRRQAPSPRWHLDEVVARIGGRRMYLWRAVDGEGEVLDLVVQERRDTVAALRLLKRLLNNQPFEPKGDRHRRACLLRLSASGPWVERPAPPWPIAREQQGRELSPADPQAGAEDVALQVEGFSSALPHHSRSRLQ
jgi:hypothetical protein